MLRRLTLLARISARRVVGRYARRTLDFAAGMLGLIGAFPVLVLAALAIKLTSPGPVLYRQVRVGLRGRHIIIFKLRSMYIDADARKAALEAQNESQGGVTFKIKQDPRITPVGRVIRKLSIDELPQLLNLVEGSMTLFGPRPPIPSEVARYGPRELRRLEVKPGLTCFWQVEGRSNLSFDQQVALDIKYVDTATATDELRILLRTVPAVLLGKGAY